MEFGENKLRIVWICHFMNKTIQEKLGMAGKEKEAAPWITLGIDEIKKRKDIELYVIAPFIKILRNCRIDEGNVHYYCIKIGIPFNRRGWPSKFSFNVWTNFYFFNLQVRRIIKRINPDLINLQGAENPYYSSSILGIKNYPIMITIQGFASLNNPTNTKILVERKRLQVEKKIFTKFKFYGIEATFMEKYIRTFNPDAKMFWFHYPFAKTNVQNTTTKEYDVVFFANIVKMKGIEDLLKAVSIAKKQMPDILLCVIGKGYDSYIEYLKNLAIELNIINNIVFKGFIPTQTKMHFEVIKARISVLPTYNDTIPGTIVESMLLGVPVISYNTGGIPDLNNNGEHVILVEQGNVNELADKILQLLNNSNKQKELAGKAREYALKEFDNANSVNLMINAYKEIIKEFRHER